VAADGSGSGKSTKKAKSLADLLREQILSEAWEAGHLLPTLQDMVDQYGVSLVTVRGALRLMVEEGLIRTGQGKRAQVTDREPTHALVIASGEAPAGRVAEQPSPYAGGPGAGAARRECSQHTAAAPRQFARLLGLTAGEPMRQRSIKLIIGGEPVLIWTSYLPTDLAGDDQRWRAVEVGQLALVGYPVAAASPRLRIRMPTPTERDALGMARGMGVGVIIRPCQVRVDELTVPAGVIVLVRGDRVFLEWGEAQWQLALD
jgi:GntR family transcriptional regulator